MKKNKWFITGIAALFLITAVVLFIFVKPTRMMKSDCVEDGSCCVDKNACACE